MNKTKEQHETQIKVNAEFSSLIKAADQHLKNEPTNERATYVHTLNVYLWMA